MHQHKPRLKTHAHNHKHIPAPHAGTPSLASFLFPFEHTSRCVLFSEFVWFSKPKGRSRHCPLATAPILAGSFFRGRQRKSRAAPGIDPYEGATRDSRPRAHGTAFAAWALGLTSKPWKVASIVSREAKHAHMHRLKTHEYVYINLYMSQRLYVLCGVYSFYF